MEPVVNLGPCHPLRSILRSVSLFTGRYTLNFTCHTRELENLNTFHNDAVLVNALIYTASLQLAYLLLVGLRGQGLMTGRKRS